jgi:hypothetical protein
MVATCCNMPPALAVSNARDQSRLAQDIKLQPDPKIGIENTMKPPPTSEFTLK